MFKPKKRRPGKVVRTLQYLNNDQRINVEIRCVIGDSRMRRAPTRGDDSLSSSITYMAVVDENGVEEEVEGKDADFVWKAICAKLDALFAIKWSPYLLVKTTNGSGRWNGEQLVTRRHIQIEYEEIEIGTKPDGKKCWRKASDAGHRGTCLHDGEPLDEPKYASRSTDEREIKALVVDTVQNRERVACVLDAIKRAGEYLQLLLEPNSIQATLDKSFVPRAFPAPTPEKQLKKAERTTK